jgi:hypothetical protein
MTNKNDFDEFLHANDKEFVELYSTQLLSNLNELFSREQKYNVLQMLLLLTFFLLKTSRIESFDIGPITVTDIGIIYVFIPIVFIYILFSMYGVAFQIQETESILNHIYKKRFLLVDSKLESNKFSRAFFPTSFAKTVKKIVSEKPNIIESIIGFLLLLPILLIGILPFGVLFLMLSEVYCSEYSNWYGKVSFYVSLWGIALLLFYIVTWIRKK